ncbi:MAG: DUF4915 domain-containing protein [Thermoguttaceae bacterium]|jgi:hypothetical protein
MKGLLVSFCNVSPFDFILGAYEFENDNFQWIKMDPLVTNCIGATGIAIAKGHYWVVWQGRGSSIIKLDANFKATAVYPLPISRDVHSILPYDGGFLVADTFRNCVNLARVSENDSTIVESEFWRQCNSVDKDEIHLNSVCNLNGETYISCFGDKPADGWQSSRMGKIININTGEVVCDRLEHPHTLFSWRGGIYWLESKTGLLHKYTPGGKHEVLMQLDGYVRGLVFDDDFIYIGASALRRFSRSTGTLNNIASDKPDDFHCWIYRVSQRTGKIERRNLTSYGAEIYDLFLVPNMPLEMSGSSNGYASAERLWRIEDDFRAREQKLQQSLHAYEEELRQCKLKLEELGREHELVQAELESLRRSTWVRIRTTVGILVHKLLR